jgi:IclR family mhp operon transcriptional activator
MAIDARLLEVLEAINDLGICTVLDLHRATGLSRPAVHRIVESLCMFGYLERVNGGSAVRLTAKVLGLSAGYRPEQRLADSAAPLLQELQQRVRWPLSFATPQGDEMVVQETTRDTNPFVFDAGHAGLRLPMPPTAMGCAYLSACEAEERAGLLRDWAGKQPQSPGAEAAISLALRRIDHAVKNGFALRSGGAERRTTTIAAPVVACGTAVGALCTTFPTSAMPLEKACAAYAPELISAAALLAANCVH